MLRFYNHPPLDLDLTTSPLLSIFSDTIIISLPPPIPLVGFPSSLSSLSQGLFYTLNSRWCHHPNPTLAHSYPPPRLLPIPRFKQRSHPPGLLIRAQPRCLSTLHLVSIPVCHLRLPADSPAASLFGFPQAPSLVSPPSLSWRSDPHYPFYL